MTPSRVPTGEVWLPDIDPPGPWTSRAACRHHNPDLWFVGPGDNRSHATAVAICADCPVRTDCLAYALRWRIQFGIWGGLSVHARRPLTKTAPRARRPPPGHGNPGRYRYGCRCDECRDAHRAETAGYRRAARGQAEA